jgi:hypothetical protein
MPLTIRTLVRWSGWLDGCGPITLGSDRMIVSGPNRSSDDNELRAISCTSSSNCACIAIGNHVNSSNAGQTLGEQWNGSTWSVVSTPDVGTLGNYVNGLSCVSPSSCVAVGYYVDGQQRSHQGVRAQEGHLRLHRGEDSGGNREKHQVIHCHLAAVAISNDEGGAVELRVRRLSREWG